MTLSTTSKRAIIAGAECAYCREPWPTEVDHILPASRGGTEDPQNLAPVCRRCNAEKGDLTPQEWRFERERFGMPWPPASQYATVMQVCQHLSVAEMSRFINLIDSGQAAGLLHDLTTRARARKWVGAEMEAASLRRELTEA